MARKDDDVTNIPLQQNRSLKVYADLLAKANGVSEQEAYKDLLEANPDLKDAHGFYTYCDPTTHQMVVGKHYNVHDLVPHQEGLNVPTKYKHMPKIEILLKVCKIEVHLPPAVGGGHHDEPPASQEASYAPVLRYPTPGEGPAQGIAGQFTNYDAAAALLVMGPVYNQKHWPTDTEVASRRGNKGNASGSGVITDAFTPLFSAAFSAGTALGTAALGGPIGVAGLLHNEPVGKRTQIPVEAVSENSDWGLRGFWLANGNLNPISRSQEERRHMFNMPFLNWDQNSQTGEIIRREDDNDPRGPHEHRTHFEAKTAFTTNGEIPGFEESQKVASTGKLNRNSNARSSLAQHPGWDSYTMGLLADQTQLRPRLNMSFATLTSTTASAADKKAAAQTALETLNYESTLQVVIANPGTAGKQLVADRAKLKAEVQKQGITGLDEHKMPDAPILTASREQQYNEAYRFYSMIASGSDIPAKGDKKLAAKYPGAFLEMYKAKFPNDPKPDLHDAGQRDAAVKKFSAELTKNVNVKQMPWTEMANFISTPHLNAFERHELDPKVPATDASIYTKAFNAISDSKEATKAMLASAATTNTDFGNALIMRDLTSVNVLNHFGEHNLHFDRSAAAHGLVERGWPQAIVDKALQAPGRGGAWLKPEDMATLRSNIAASANNPAIVTLRQKDVKEMPTDGSSHNRNLQPGEIARTVLHNMAAEHSGANLESNTYAKVLASVAPSAVEDVKAATYFAVDDITLHAQGITRSGMEARGQQQLAGLKEQNVTVPVPGGVDPKNQHPGATVNSVDAPAGQPAGKPGDDAHRLATAQALAASLSGSKVATTVTAPHIKVDAQLLAQTMPDAKRLQAELANPSTRPSVLAQLANPQTGNPNLLENAILETALTKPELTHQLANAMAKAGHGHKQGLLNQVGDVFGSDRSHQLGNDLEKLSEALHSNNTKDIVKYQGQLNDFIQTAKQVDAHGNPTKDAQKNLQALGDMNSLILTGQSTGTSATLPGSAQNQIAVAKNISLAIDSVLAGNPNAGGSLINELTGLKQLANNVVNGSTLPNINALVEGLEHLPHSISGKFKLHMVPFPNGGSTPPDQSIPIKPPVNCHCVTDQASRDFINSMNNLSIKQVVNARSV